MSVNKSSIIQRPFTFGVHKLPDSGGGGYVSCYASRRTSWVPRVMDDDSQQRERYIQVSVKAAGLSRLIY
jgi:hypothetical protein